MPATLSDRMRDALREFVEVPEQLNAEAEQLEAQAKEKRKEAREAEKILVLKGLIVKAPDENGAAPKKPKQPAVSDDPRAQRSIEKVRRILPDFEGEAFTASGAAAKAGLSWSAGNRAVEAIYASGEIRKVGLRKPAGGHGSPTVHYKAE